LWEDPVYESHIYINSTVGGWGKKDGDGPRLTWINDVIEWTGLKTYRKVKRTAKDRDKSRAIVVNLLKEDDK